MVLPYLLILVKSKYSHFDQRDTIRKTWGQSDDQKLIRTVFLIGYPEQNVAEYNRLISKEAKENGDLIQQNFIDSYYNNTLKTSMAIKWINRYCSRSKYYLLIDDDFYLSKLFIKKYFKTFKDLKKNEFRSKVINELFSQ